MNTTARAVLATSLLLGCDASPGGETSHAASSTTAVASARPPPSAPASPTTIAAPADVARPPADAERTSSGLVTKVLQKGTGTEHPRPYDSVKVHYTGWTRDGKMFDSSVARKRPSSFRVTQVIPGWTEGLQLMVVGEKRRLWIPAELAYGKHPKRPGAPAGDLTFDVELLGTEKGIAPPEPPQQLDPPPKEAKKTASGLAHEVLVKGKGQRPKPTDVVAVHYTGWTTDGKMFDSSVVRGQPAVFRLDQVVKGWSEGVPLMNVGGKSRLYIPAKLAYGDKPRPGAPSGPLVFEIELLEIKQPRSPRPAVSRQ